ncbi:SepM family pheromone-processing serine protease [Shouchella sp. JSM 1781072]|uniref:SepM family pheromone-processing serine protease n=1 Tax=Bacillaceae TaxID=186817 RepID=UPI0020D17B23|nr:SepM family pheromone-processing serine protease [Alkalihalobacillus sp. LMS6]UTR04867.1 PDZ domain-containing protein [Alkalihalobacillus sp. LMS6]
MEQKRKSFPWVKWLVLVVVLLVIVRLELPYYYSQPGLAQSVEEMVDVRDGNKDDEGTFMLTTVRSAKATPALMAWSWFSEFRSLNPAPSGMTDEEYDQRQQLLMSNSQDDAKIAAFQASEAGEVEIEYTGVYVVGTTEGMSADEQLEPGDIITHVDGEAIETSEALIDTLAMYSEGDIVTLTFEREEETLMKNLEFSSFPDELNMDRDRVGVGVSVETVRTTTFTPEVDIAAGAIGGPSAGLIFALEVYSQLEDIDLTAGYQIAGTGTINEDGDVGSIGGANQKVVASDRAGADYFLVPTSGNNYEDARAAAESINTDMEIVPIQTFEEALSFLETLQDE